MKKMKVKTMGRFLTLLLTTVLMASVLATPALAADIGRKEFDDVSSDAWYHEAVTTLASDGLMNWYADGLFHPEYNMSVRDIISALNKAFYGEKMPTTTADKQAYNWEGVSWVPAGFAPDYSAKATRKQACALLLLAMDIEVPADSDPIALALSGGYIGTYGEAGNPFTRAELASVLYGMMYGIAANPTAFLVMDYQLEGFSQEELGMVQAAMDSALEFIPEQLKASFIDEGYTLYGAELETYKTLWRQFTPVGSPDNSTGMFLKSKKVILVNNIVPETVSHEFGHYLMTLGDLETITNLYNLEKDGVILATGRDYGCTSVDEFFAEVFRCYCTRNYNLRWTPQTAAYIEELLGQI